MHSQINNPFVSQIDSLNQIISSRFNGISDTVNIDYSCVDEQCFLSLVELGSDNLIYYVLSNGQRVSVYGPDNELQFFDDFDFNINENVNVTGENKKYIIVSNENLQEIYLYDSDFNPTSVFSAQGSFKTIVGDINFDGLDDVVTITIDGQVIAYTINSTFN